MDDPAVSCVHQHAPGLEERKFTRPADDEAFGGMDLSKCGDLLIIKTDGQTAAHGISCPSDVLLTDLVGAACVSVFGGPFGQAYKVAKHSPRSIGEGIQACVRKQVSFAGSMTENTTKKLQPFGLCGVDREFVVGMVEDLTDTAVIPYNVSNWADDDDSDVALLKSIYIIADERDELFGLRQAVKSIESQNDKVIRARPNVPEAAQRACGRVKRVWERRSLWRSEFARDLDILARLNIFGT